MSFNDSEYVSVHQRNKQSSTFKKKHRTGRTRQRAATRKILRSKCEPSYIAARARKRAITGKVLRSNYKTNNTPARARPCAATRKARTNDSLRFTRKMSLACGTSEFPVDITTRHSELSPSGISMTPPPATKERKEPLPLSTRNRKKSAMWIKISTFTKMNMKAKKQTCSLHRAKTEMSRLKAALAQSKEQESLTQAVLERMSNQHAVELAGLNSKVAAWQQICNSLRVKRDMGLNNIRFSAMKTVRLPKHSGVSQASYTQRQTSLANHNTRNIPKFNKRKHSSVKEDNWPRLTRYH